MVAEDGEEEHLQEIGDRFGVSWERIRQQEVCLLRRLRSTILGDRALVHVLREHGYGITEEEMKMAAKMEKQKRYKAIVVHGKPQDYEANGLARKLADRGVDVARTYFITFPQNVKRQDWRGVDFIVLITSSVDRAGGAG